MFEHGTSIPLVQYIYQVGLSLVGWQSACHMQRTINYKAKRNCHAKKSADPNIFNHISSYHHEDPLLTPTQVSLVPYLPTTLRKQKQPTVDGRNTAPVEVGSLSHYLQGFRHPVWLFGISEPSTVSQKAYPA